MTEHFPTHQGRIAVVTGAGGALGGRISEVLAARGATVIGVDIADLSATEERVVATGSEFAAFKVDLTSAEQVATLGSDIESRFGRLDILVNNAGILPSADIVDHSVSLWQKVIDVNLTSQFLTISTLSGLMKKKGWGRIVNVTSSSIESPILAFGAYKASKMGVIGLTRGAAADLAGYGIRVNAISPPLMRTPGQIDLPDEAYEPIVQVQTIKRLGEPADAAGLVAFLSSDDAEFITGQTVYADGGLAYN